MPELKLHDQQYPSTATPRPARILISRGGYRVVVLEEQAGAGNLRVQAWLEVQSGEDRAGVPRWTDPPYEGPVAAAVGTVVGAMLEDRFEPPAS